MKNSHGLLNNPSAIMSLFLRNAFAPRIDLFMMLIKICSFEAKLHV